MPRFLVDSNVLLDVMTEDPKWFEWSAESLERAANEGVLVVNPLIYAEVSVRFETIEALEEVLRPDLFEREPLPWEAGFLAGKCFQRYRRSGGVRRSPLPDFYIGAHAAVRGLTLITRDGGRYRSYFPTIGMRVPEDST